METTESDLLFQKYSIQELRAILTKTKGEVEAKKSELKIRVGEKYRDVLQAADSIRLMKDASSELTLNLQSTIELCKIKNVERPIIHSQVLKQGLHSIFDSQFISFLCR